MLHDKIREILSFTVNDPSEMSDYCTGPALVIPEGDSRTAVCSFIEKLFLEKFLVVAKEDILAKEQSPALRKALHV